MDKFIVILIPLLMAAYCGAKPHISRETPLRIINGTDVKEGEFPYMVQLFSAGSFFCGGSIIGAKWILTSGHCIDFEAQYIVYGSNQLADIDSIDTKVKVKKSYKHPKYSGERTYDVGILELEEGIPLNGKAQTIKMADSNNVPFHVLGILPGWGVIKPNSKSASSYLKKLELKLLNDTECTEAVNAYAQDNVFDSVHDLCSDNHLNGQCDGDAGGPFVINGLVYGISSWSLNPCGSSPGTFSRLTNPEYRSFIKNVSGI